MKRFFALALALALMLSLCACTSSRHRTEYSADEAYTYSSAAPVYSDYNAMAVAEEAYGGFAASGNSAYAPVPEPAPAAEAETELSRSSDSDLTPEKIIYSGDATVETTQFDDTLAALEAMIDRLGGWVESSSVTGAKYSSVSSGSKSNRSASYTVRVPGEKFSELMNSLSSLGNVPSSRTYSENVTSQYYDTEARLKTYQAQEQRLIELLDMADTVSDVIEIENELTEVRYRIESLQTSLRSWDRKVSWSTLNLSVREVTEYTPEPPVGFGSRLADAFFDGIDALGDFLLGLVEVLPVLIVSLALLFFVLRLIVRAVRNPEKSAARREARKAKKAAKKAAPETESEE